MTPGEYIRSCRHNAQKTLSDVADDVGLSIPYLSDVERGKRYVPRSRTVRRALCEAVGGELAEVDRLEAREEGVISVRDLPPEERERVYLVVAELRRARAA